MSSGRKSLKDEIQIKQRYADLTEPFFQGIELARELEHFAFGILCMRPENLEAPWIHFEAGTLSKQGPPTLLVVRVFQQDAQTEFLFDEVSSVGD